MGKEPLQGKNKNLEEYTSPATQWLSDNIEDTLLETYHEIRGGRIYTQVRVGYRGEHRNRDTSRFLDAIRIPSPSHCAEEIVRFRNHKEEFQELLTQARFGSFSQSSGFQPPPYQDTIIELIEVKRKLNYSVLGEISTKGDLFPGDYPNVSRTSNVIICSEQDQHIDYVCSGRDIEVVPISL